MGKRIKDRREKKQLKKWQLKVKRIDRRKEWVPTEGRWKNQRLSIKAFDYWRKGKKSIEERKGFGRRKGGDSIEERKVNQRRKEINIRIVYPTTTISFMDNFMGVNLHWWISI